MRALFFCLFICLSITGIQAQKGVKAFGIQVKPIFPLGLVNTDGQVIKDAGTGSTLSIDVNSGYNIGAVIRFGITDRFSFETGIKYTARNYSFNLTNPGFPTSTADLRFPGYEIPAMIMVFVRLSENIHMSVSAGVSFDMFPTSGVVTSDRDSIEYGLLEQNWVILSLVTNIGFEYRTEKSGYFYLGASYHSPFGDLADVFVSYRETNSNEHIILIEPFPSVSGNYISLDLRYYFNPESRKNSNK